MVRSVSIDKNGVKKGVWSQEEDDKLRDYIMRYGYCNWRKLPKFAGLSRCGKSCRLRWMNYLRPDVKRGNFSKEEDDFIIQLHQQLGNKWSKIAMNLPGRTDNDIKNHWHTRLKKKMMKSQILHEEGAREQYIGNPEREVSNSTIDLEAAAFYPIIMESFPSMFDEVCDNWVGKNSIPNSVGILVESGADFWTQPFVLYSI